jgi:hypothetical protein
MDITIENCSSPGASFTDNTRNVLLKVYDWIIEKNYPTLSFRSFRTKTSSDKEINDNNARNIYPMARSCGFLSYEKGENINTKFFFTKTGNAFVKSLESIRFIQNSNNFSENQKTRASKEFEDIISTLIAKGLVKMMKQQLNYKDDFKAFCSFLAKYEKINKVEFALLLYYKQKSIPDFINIMEDDLKKYRDDLISINVKVDIRDDSSSAQNSRKTEDIGFLTSYTYFTGLLQQAGIIYKSNTYFILDNSKKLLLKEIMEA